MDAPIVLVSMPYHAVERPNMALGILGATLRAEGVPVRCWHANIEFAAMIGLEAFDAILSSFSGLQFGELTFTEAAFAGDAPRHQGYLADIAAAHARSRPSARFEVPRLFYRVRDAAVGFIDRCARDLVARRPRLVGCSSMFEQHVPSLALLRRIKELDSSIVTVIGGPNVEGPMGRATVNSFPWVDCVVSGEADSLIVPLCRAVLDGRPLARGQLPPGVFTRNPLVSAGSECARVVVADMDEVAIPDFSDYFDDLARSEFADRVLPGLTVETSRGCWYGEKNHCTFCGQNGMGMGFRAKSPARVVDELRTLVQRHQIAAFGMVDNILAREYFDTALPELERDPTEYRIFYEIKPNLRRPQLEQLWRSGVRSVIPGFESLDDEPLALMRKGTTLATNLQTLKWAGELGIYVHWIFLHGIPGESDAVYERLAALIPKLVHLQPPNLATPIEFHRFSPYGERPHDFGLELVPHPAYAAIYPVPAQQLRELAYYFVDVSGGPWNTCSARRGEVLALLGQWIQAHLAGASLVLEACADGSAIVHDRRRPQDPRELRLTACQAAVAGALDGGRGLRGLHEQLQPAGWTAQDVDAALAALVHDDLVLDCGGKFLCLAMRERRVPAWLDYKAPHGVVLPRGAARPTVVARHPPGQESDHVAAFELEHI